MVDDAVFPLVVALVAAGMLTAVAVRLALGRLRASTAALAGGALGALVTSEFTVDGAGDWWQRHPSTGAALTGILLLALTVLVVETAVERALTAAEENRWRPVGQVAATQILAQLAAPIRDFQDETIWAMGEGVETLMKRSPRTGSGERARVFAEEVSDVVLGAAPVLAATKRLQQVYGHAVQVAGIANELSRSIPAWERDDSEDASLPMWASESARLTWWTTVGVPWQRLAEAATAFEDEAWEQLEAAIDDEPWAPPWREQPSEQYTRALREYLDEYDPASAADASAR